METREAVEHFGDVAALARALGITHQAIYRWRGTVPPRRALELERLTGGALVATGAPGAPPRRGKRRTATGATEAPKALPIEQLQGLQAWAATEHPGLQPRVAELVAACLDWHRSNGKRRKDWPATCRNWIRKQADFDGNPRGGGSGGAKRTASEEIADLF